MQTAADRLAPAIAGAPIVESPILFAMNVPGDFVEGADAVKRNLSLQVTHSVRWEQAMQAMKQRGVGLYLELGCGKTLTGLMKKINPDATALSVDKAADLEQAATLLEKGVGCSS